jgi:hypothetical protein
MAVRVEALLAGDERDLSAAAEMGRELNLMLARMAGNSLLEWLMHTVQMGFSSKISFCIRILIIAKKPPPTGVIPPGPTPGANPCCPCLLSGITMDCCGGVYKRPNCPAAWTRHMCLETRRGRI